MTRFELVANRKSTPFFKPSCLRLENQVWLFWPNCFGEFEVKYKVEPNHQVLRVVLEYWDIPSGKALREFPGLQQSWFTTNSLSQKVANP